MAYTIGGLVSEARGLLQDVIPLSGATRYSDADLVLYLNDALTLIRAKRPDAFLALGMTTPVPSYSLPADVNTAWPLDTQFYPPVLYFVVGTAELREDTFSEDSRAVTLMNKFVSNLLQAAS